MCRKRAASTPLLSPSCKSSPLLLTVFPTRFISHYWLTRSISFFLQPAISLGSGTRETRGVGRAAFGKRWIFIAVCWLPPPFLLPFLLFDISRPAFRSLPPEGCQPALPWPSSQNTPSCSAGTFGRVIRWEETLPVGVQFKSAFSPLKTKTSAFAPHPKRETCLAPIGRSSFSPLGMEKAFAFFAFGLGGAASCGVSPDVHHPLPRRVIKMAGSDSRNITTFSHFNLIWSSQAFQAHSIWYFLLQRLFLRQLPGIPSPHPPPHLFLHLVYLFTVKRKGIYCFIHIKWLSCNRNKLLVPI